MHCFQPALERLRGAVTRVVEGWSAHEVSAELSQDKKPFIMLVDPEYAGLTAAMVLNPSLLTTAQPEVHPDLLRPDAPAGSPEG